MYTASVVRIKVAPIEGAKTIAKGLLPGGTEVVVNKDTLDGTLGVFFPEGGQLSEDFLFNNKLYRRDPKSGLAMGGYFEANGRVRAQKFMGVKSNGFWCPLEYLENMGINHAPEEGTQFDTLEGKRICWKYETPATKAARAAKQREAPTVRIVLPRHYETPRFDQADPPDPNDWVIITSKLHGTSAATGNVPVQHTGLRYKIINLIGKLLRVKLSDFTYSIEHRTRNTYISARPDIHQNNSSDRYRLEVMRDVAPYLTQGEIIYYEIVGYDSNGNLIMPSGDNSKLGKEYVRQYGQRTNFTYGCNIENEPQKVFVYRIAHVSPDGSLVELSWPQVQKRCRDLGLKTVPVLWQGFYGDIMGGLDQFVEGPSVIDPTHMREGICIRAEKSNGDIIVLKQKSNAFSILEGLIKQDDSLVDVEESN